MLGVEEVFGGSIVVRVNAEALDVKTSRDFRQQVDDTLKRKQQIVLDLSKMAFVDSSGLNVLISCQRQINAAGGEMKLCALSPQVRALFQLMQMHRVFSIYNTPEEALRAFQ